MALNPELKALLVCPKCKGALSFHEERGEIECPTCRLIFAIQEDIPILLLDEARPMPAAAP